MRMKKFLTILLTLAMVLSLLPQAAFAANNTATTMRLAKTQGTVAVTNATGKKVTQTSNMKLYNGYKLKTGAKSYAWISLDDTKVAKLDANSVVSVQKTGQKLTLYLSSGNLFFNVKETLKSGESFQIKTSTMTTGIRGTSGCVRIINDRVTELHLLTGEMEVYTEHPELGISDTKILKAGQKARSMIAEYSMAEVGRQAAIIIEKLGAHEVCGICSEEISRSMALQNRMVLDGGFTVEEVESIVASHDERLAHDEAVADARAEVIAQKVDDQVFPDDVDPLFEEEKEESKSSGGSSGGGSGGSSSGGSTDDDSSTGGNSGELEEADLEREVDTEEELLDALDEYNALSGTMKITLTDDITMDSDALNEVLMERNGGKTKLTIDTNGYTLTLAEPIENNSDLTIKGDGTVEVISGTAIINNGTLTLDGATITSSYPAEDSEDAEYSTPVAIENAQGAVFTMKSGSITSDEFGVINDGKAVISGGTITVNDGGTGIMNRGDLTISDNAVIDVTGEGIAVENSVYYDPDYGYGYSLRRTSSENGETYGAVTMTGGTIKMSGEEVNDRYAYGIANGYEKNKVVMEGGTIEVNGMYAVGIRSGDVKMSGGTIEVPNGYGVQVQNPYDTFEMTGGKINVSAEDSEYGGISSVGITTKSEIGATSEGDEEEETPVNVILAENAEINVSGSEGAVGIWIYSADETLAINGGMITVTGGYGIWLYGTLLIGDTEYTIEDIVFENGVPVNPDTETLCINATASGKAIYQPQS